MWAGFVITSNEYGEIWCFLFARVILWKVSQVAVLDRARHDAQICSISNRLWCDVSIAQAIGNIEFEEGFEIPENHHQWWGYQHRPSRVAYKTRLLQRRLHLAYHDPAIVNASLMLLRTWETDTSFNGNPDALRLECAGSHFAFYRVVVVGKLRLSGFTSRSCFLYGQATTGAIHQALDQYNALSST